MAKNLYKITNGASLLFIPGMKDPMIPGEIRVLSQKDYYRSQTVIKTMKLKVQVIRGEEEEKVVVKNDTQELVEVSPLVSPLKPGEKRELLESEYEQRKATYDKLSVTKKASAAAPKPAPAPVVASSANVNPVEEAKADSVLASLKPATVESEPETDKAS